MNIPAEQLDSLYSYCIDFSSQMLAETGEFYPFGAVLGLDGKVKAAGGWNGQEHPNPREIFTLLANAFEAQAKANEVLAVAICANVDIPPEFEPIAQDGIRVQLEAPQYSRTIYTPYRLQKKGLFRKKFVLELHDPFAVQTEPRFFLGGPDA